jgi:hypothetical protein
MQNAIVQRRIFFLVIKRVMHLIVARKSVLFPFVARKSVLFSFVARNQLLFIAVVNVLLPAVVVRGGAVDITLPGGVKRCVDTWTLSSQTGVEASNDSSLFVYQLLLASDYLDTVLL